jgi:IstB-like ATP binding protein
MRGRCCPPARRSRRRRPRPTPGDIVAAAMIDRLVHHAEVIALKGDKYRLKDRDLGRLPAAATDEP